MFTVFNGILKKKNNCYTYTMECQLNPHADRKIIFCGSGCLQEGGEWIDLEDLHKISWNLDFLMILI
jgi:hypothetical protein